MEIIVDTTIAERRYAKVEVEKDRAGMTSCKGTRTLAMTLMSGGVLPALLWAPLTFLRLAIQR